MGSTFKGKTLLLLRSKFLPLGKGLIGGRVFLSVCGPRKQTGIHNTCRHGKMAEKHVNDGIYHMWRINRNYLRMIFQDSPYMKYLNTVIIIT